MSFYLRLLYNLHSIIPITENLKSQSLIPKGFNNINMTKNQKKWADSYTEQFPNGRFAPRPKSMEKLRANFGETIEKAQQNISEFLYKHMNIHTNLYEIYTIPPKHIDIDVKRKISGSFYALKIVFNTDVKIFENTYKKGDVLVLTNSVKTDKVSVIHAKELTPVNMNLVSFVYESKNQLLKKLKQRIDASNYPEQYKKVLRELPYHIANDKNNLNIFKNFFEYANSNMTIMYDRGKEFFNNIDESSLNYIQNEYGEILGGLMLFNILENTGCGLRYSTSGNEKLIDFRFDGNKISAKGGKGSSPSGDSIIRYIHRCYKNVEILFEKSEEKEFLEKIIEKWIYPEKIDKRSNVYNIVMTLAHVHLKDDSGYSFLSSTLGTQGYITREEILNFFDNLSKNEKQFESFIKIFARKCGSPTNDISSKILLYNKKCEVNDRSRIGLIFYYIEFELVKRLNKKYKDILTHYIQKVSDIYQLYLKIDRNDGVIFDLKKFNESSFVFSTKNSTDEPFQSNICIEMVKNKK